jgi:hypothetical protein
MSEWKLADCIDPVEKLEDTPTIVIQSEAHLREVLDRLRQRRPGIVFLVSPSNEYFEMGLGGPFAGMRWMRPPTEKFAREAIADPVRSPEAHGYSAEGVDTVFEPKNLFLVEEVIEAAVYFFNHHRLPEWITWSEWDPVAYKWNLIPGIPKSPTRPQAQTPEAEVRA